MKQPEGKTHGYSSRSLHVNSVRYASPTWKRSDMLRHVQFSSQPLPNSPRPFTTPIFVRSGDDDHPPSLLGPSTLQQLIPLLPPLHPLHPPFMHLLRHLLIPFPLLLRSPLILDGLYSRLPLRLRLLLHLSLFRLRRCGDGLRGSSFGVGGLASRGAEGGL